MCIRDREREASHFENVQGRLCGCTIPSVRGSVDLSYLTICASVHLGRAYGVWAFILRLPHSPQDLVGRVAPTPMRRGRGRQQSRHVLSWRARRIWRSRQQLLERSRCVEYVQAPRDALTVCAECEAAISKSSDRWNARTAVQPSSVRHERVSSKSVLFTYSC